MESNQVQGATIRTVMRGERDGAATYIVRASRPYSAPPDEVWNAITDRERLPLWFAKVEGAFAKGGRYAIEGNADGKIVVCEPPRHLALTWEFADNVSWVSVSIEASGDGAVLTLDHEHPTDPESMAHWDRYGPGATGVGWELAMVGLHMHLDGDGTSTIKAGEAWATSEAGKASLRDWAEAWGLAHTESGTEAQIASASAKRTAAFYTGEDL